MHTCYFLTVSYTAYVSNEYKMTIIIMHNDSAKMHYCTYTSYNVHVYYAGSAGCLRYNYKKHSNSILTNRKRGLMTM